MSKPPSSSGSRVRVPKSEHLLLRALAALKNGDCGEVLIELIRTEASRMGLSPETVSKVLGEKKRPVSEMAQSLRAERIKRGATQAELSKDLGISESYLAAVENGIKPITKKLQETVRRWLSQPPPPREGPPE